MFSCTDVRVDSWLGCFPPLRLCQKPKKYLPDFCSLRGQEFFLLFIQNTIHCILSVGRGEADEANWPNTLLTGQNGPKFKKIKTKIQNGKGMDFFELVFFINFWSLRSNKKD